MWHNWRWLPTWSINLRSLCSPVVPNTYFGCYVSVVTSTHAIDAKDPLFALARTYDDQLKGEILPAGEAIFPALFSKKEVKEELSARWTAQKRAFPMGFVITNLGTLPFPQTYGALRWESLFFTTSRQAGDVVMLLNANTLHNRLMLCFTYTLPLISQKQAEQFAKGVVDLISLNS